MWRHLSLKLIILNVLLSSMVNCTSASDEDSCEHTSLDCGEHGACHDSNGVGACVCDAKYTGETCADVVPDTCNSAPLDCGDHGMCDDTEDGMVCVCDFGFIGSDCSQSAPANALYLYGAGDFGVEDFAGQRMVIDSLAQSNLPSQLPGISTTAYLAHGFIGMTGDAIVDFPSAYNISTTIPVYGIDDQGNTILIAHNWADFLDGTILTTIATALGFTASDYTYFWTGSNNDGTAAGHDCSGWSEPGAPFSNPDSSLWSYDAVVSKRSNVTENWLQETDSENNPFLALCSSTYKLLGLAYCTSRCPSSLP